MVFRLIIDDCTYGVDFAIADAGVGLDIGADVIDGVNHGQVVCPLKQFVVAGVVEGHHGGIDIAGGELLEEAEAETLFDKVGAAAIVCNDGGAS